MLWLSWPQQAKGRASHGRQSEAGQGGKDGKVIEPYHADDSEMIRRLSLPVDDQDHMPPKEKPQPSESQIALLHWWISQGASLQKK